MSRLKSEIKALVRLALPVSLAQLALVGMSATDVLIAGHASTVDLAGMNLGANTWNMIVLFFMGIGIATQPLVAKHFGARNMVGVKHQLHQSLWLCLALGVVAMLSVWLTAWAISWLPYEPEMLRIARDYLIVVSLGAIPLTLTPAVRGTLEGMNQTMVVFVVNFAAFVLNIPLDYIFVYGLFGFPQLGGVGCAVATAILLWLMFLANAAALLWRNKLRHLELFSNFQRPDRKTLAATFKLGFPIGVSIVVELSMFCGAGMMIAAFGVIEASSHAVAITVASMSFMLYMGLGQGVTIRASQFLGAERPGAAWYAVKAGTGFNLLVAAFMCVLFLVFTESLVGLFTNDPEVLQLATVLLYFGAAFQLADSLQVAVICALRAYHDTSSPPKYQFFAFWIVGLPLGIGLAFYGWWPGLEGAKGLWTGMVGSLFLVGFLLLYRLWTRVDEFSSEFDNTAAQTPTR